MPKMPDIQITLINSLGPKHCPNGHSVGDSWICSGPNTPAGMCSNLYVAMYPTIWMMQNGGGPDVMQHVCQDASVMGVFEIKRLPEKDQ